MVPPPDGCPPAVFDQYFSQLKLLQDMRLDEDPQIPIVPDAARPLLSNPRIVPALPRPTPGLGRPVLRRGNEIVDTVSPGEPNIPQSFSPSFSGQNELSEIPYTPYLVNNNKAGRRADSPKGRRPNQNERNVHDSPAKRLRIEQAGVAISLLDDNLATEADPSPSPSFSLPGLSPEIRHSNEVESYRQSPSKQIPTSLIIRPRARGSWRIPSPTPLPNSHRGATYRTPDPDLATPRPPRFSPEASENSPIPFDKSNAIEWPPGPCLEELPNNSKSNEAELHTPMPEQKLRQFKSNNSSDLSLPSLSSDLSFSPHASPVRSRPDPEPAPPAALPKPKLKLPSFVLGLGSQSLASIPSAQVASKKRQAKR